MYHVSNPGHMDPLSFPLVSSPPQSAPPPRLTLHQCFIHSGRTEIFTDRGNDTVYVRGVGGPLYLHTGDGSDEVTIGDAVGDMSKINSLIVVDGEGTAGDVVCFFACTYMRVCQCGCVDDYVVLPLLLPAPASFFVGLGASAFFHTRAATWCS